MKIYMTKRNSDPIEGKGPMVNDKAFLYKEHAEAYIDTQPGIMGRKAKWSQEKYGDWTIVEIEIVEHDVVEHDRIKKEMKEKALAKLTDEEREVLGL
jgi:hypothetical protein